MTIAKACRIGAAISALSVIVLVCSTIFVITGTREMESFAQRKFDSILLAQEVRATSSGLTASARAYVSSLNDAYEKQYWDLVHIRGGDMPRPADAQVAPGQTVPLDTLLVNAGFTQEELGLLRESTTISAALVLIEEEAMNAVKGLFKGADGTYSRKGDPDMERGRQLMFGAEYDKVVRQIMEPSYKFDKLVNERIDAGSAKVNGILDIALVALVGSVIVIAVVLFAGVILLIRRIVAPVRASAEFATALAEGDLESDYTGPAVAGNEVGLMVEAMRSMVVNIKQRIHHTEEKSREAEEQREAAAKAVEDALNARNKAKEDHKTVMQAAEEVEAVVSRLSVATEQLSAQVESSAQAAVLQQDKVASAAHALNSMSAIIMEVARTADSASLNSAGARERAESGADIVRRSVEALEVVKVDSQELSSIMEKLGSQAKAIDSIITVINDIADQTNLLALNAAIEAARAGEAGRGFAVVADEVRKLAEKTMSATSEVNQTVQGIQKGTLASMEAMEKTHSNVARAVGLSEESGQALAGIVESTKDMEDQISCISTGSQNQSESCDGMVGALNEIQSLASETSEAMRQSSEAVSDLAVQASQLQLLVGRLRSE